MSDSNQGPWGRSVGALVEGMAILAVRHVIVDFFALVGLFVSFGHCSSNKGNQDCYYDKLVHFG